MPAMMNLYEPMEIVVLPEVTYSLDKADANTLYDQITVFDHSLTRPYFRLQKAIRSSNRRPVRFANVYAENNIRVSIEHNAICRSADGKLMPSKKNQAPPDLRYFQANALIVNACDEVHPLIHKVDKSARRGPGIGACNHLQI
jgi:hypothetical protein